MLARLAATASLLVMTTFSGPQPDPVFVVAAPLPPPPPPPAYPAYVPEVEAPAPRPTLQITVLRGVRVTACSPQDPVDRAYYAAHGYEGRTYGVAADLRKLPRGTIIRVPGYRGGAWHYVDSAGGSVIRRSSRAGVLHIDVKYRTYKSAKKWGSQVLDIEVIYPQHFNEASDQLSVR